MYDQDKREDDSTKEIEFVPEQEAELDNAFLVAGDVEVGIDQSKDSAVVAKARRFVESVQSGKKPGEAAKAIGSSLREINDSPTMKAMVGKLIETASLPAEIRIQMVQSFLNKTLLESAMSSDPEAKKIGLQAAKQISQEIGIGLTQSDNGITINLGALEGKLDGITLTTGSKDEKTIDN